MTEYTTEILHHGPNIITVSRPVLSPAEREKRMVAVKQAAVNLTIAAERNRVKKGPQPVKI